MHDWRGILDLGGERVVFTAVPPLAPEAFLELSWKVDEKLMSFDLGDQLNLAKLSIFKSGTSFWHLVKFFFPHGVLNYATGLLQVEGVLLLLYISVSVWLLQEASSLSFQPLLKLERRVGLSVGKPPKVRLQTWCWFAELLAELSIPSNWQGNKLSLWNGGLLLEEKPVAWDRWCSRCLLSGFCCCRLQDAS